MQLWFSTPLSPLAWGWPSPTRRRLTALTHFPSEYQKRWVPIYPQLFVCCFHYTGGLTGHHHCGLFMSWWFALSWPAQIAAIYERFTGFWFWREQTECVVMWIAAGDYIELLVSTQNASDYHTLKCIDAKHFSILKLDLQFLIKGNKSYYSSSFITIIFIVAYQLWQWYSGAQREVSYTRWAVSLSASVAEHMVAIQLQSKPPLFSHKCCVFGRQLFSLLECTHTHMHTTHAPHLNVVSYITICNCCYSFL